MHSLIATAIGRKKRRLPLNASHVKTQGDEYQIMIMQIIPQNNQQKIVHVLGKVG